jgi:hypothetical protein
MEFAEIWCWQSRLQAVLENFNLYPSTLRATFYYAEIPEEAAFSASRSEIMQ